MLAAINDMLRAVGETRITSLIDLPLDAAEAKGTLESVLTDVQLHGWYWNTELIRMVPDGTSKIPLPPNVLEIKGTGNDHNRVFTIRGGHLYELKSFASTATFDRPVDLEVTFALPFDDLPASARAFVTLKAARLFAAQMAADEMSLRASSEEETRAWVQMQSEDNENRPRSLLDSWSVKSILTRGVDHFYNNGGY